MNFTSIQIQGNILSLELFDKIRHDQQVPFQTNKDFGFKKGANIRDHIGSAWSEARLMWSIYKNKIEALDENDYGTSETRKLWMVPFLMNLGYDPDITNAENIAGKAFPISHRDLKLDRFPILIMGYADPLDRKPAGNRLRMSPHALMQEYLNYTEHLFGIVSNGRFLRILRDSNRLSKLAFIEFDIERMMEEELYHEFALMYRVIHVSRMPQSQDKIEESIIEQYHQDSIESGSRIRNKLRMAVKESMEVLANGFLKHLDNQQFRENAKAHQIDSKVLYKLLLRTIYRLIFIATIEERNLVFPRKSKDDQGYEDYLKNKQTYQNYYSLERLRKLAVSRVYLDPSKQDLWKSLLTTFRMFEPLALGKKIGVQALGGELFSAFGLMDTDIDFYKLALSNSDTLIILSKLTSFRNNSGTLNRVNYRDLDVEELGSVYEALLELHPYINTDSSLLYFAFTEGSERKLTGSYYTRHDLVAQLIKTALFPVIEERLSKAASREDKEKVLLEIKVCDPAAGSGHFLIAAARALGFELAKVRSGEDNPGLEWVQTATRDVIQNCIYGVDKNPAAVELCRISLWLIGHSSGKPLTFIEHKIKNGDSLVGVDNLERLKGGIPQSAFNPVTGDDSGVAVQAKRINRQFLQSKGQQTIFAQADALIERQGHYADQYKQLSELSVESIADYETKRTHYQELSHNPGIFKSYTSCNLFTYAFFQTYTSDKTEVEIVNGATLSGQLRSLGSFNPRVEGHANAAAVEYNFFHWPLEFPDVFEKGGFDVMLGNPPWERIKLQEKEFFSALDDDISNAPNAAARKRMIIELEHANSKLYQLFCRALFTSEASSKFIRNSGLYPLTGRGDINTYSIFSEQFKKFTNSKGRSGFIVPTGIATDDTNKFFFAELVRDNQLISLFDFENRKKIFQNVHSRYKFSLLTIGPTKAARKTIFGFFLHDILDLQDHQRIFSLTKEDFLNINPNTKTTPIFRTRYDAELTAKIYSRVPVLINEEKNQNPWGISFMRMFDMSNDSHLFKTEPELTQMGFTLKGNRFTKGEDMWLPLYEGKYIWYCDHRYADYYICETRNSTRELGNEAKEPYGQIIPWYWINLKDIDRKSDFNWSVGFRDVTNSTNERSFVPSFTPKAGINHKEPILISVKGTDEIVLLYCCLSSLCFDYIVRQKLGGTSMTYFYVKQFPVLQPEIFPKRIKNAIQKLGFELAYTSWDIKAFADDLWNKVDQDLKSLITEQWQENQSETGGNEWIIPDWVEAYPEIAWEKDDGIPIPPFKWDENRRARLKAELDAYFALLYGLERDDLRYILDPQEVHGEDFPGESFRVLKKKDIRKYGEYRTRKLVLEAYDRLRPGWDMEVHQKRLKEVWEEYQEDLSEKEEEKPIRVERGKKPESINESLSLLHEPKLFEEPNLFNQASRKAKDQEPVITKDCKVICQTLKTDREVKIAIISYDSKATTPDGYQSISPESALFRAIVGLKVGERFRFGVVEYEIIDVLGI